MSAVFATLPNGDFKNARLGSSEIGSRVDAVIICRIVTFHNKVRLGIPKEDRT
jgi:hypothetical protein